MGQQQLLLLVLAVIIVGITLVVGIQMFAATTASANFDAVLNDLLKLGANAQAYYLKPVHIGGGGNSFKKVTMEHLTTKPENDNGTYSIKNSRKNKVVLRGVGKLDGDGDGRNCRILLHVFVDSVAIKIKRR